jgi:hypothetical protein
MKSGQGVDHVKQGPSPASSRFEAHLVKELPRPRTQLGPGRVSCPRVPEPRVLGFLADRVSMPRLRRGSSPFQLDNVGVADDAPIMAAAHGLAAVDGAPRALTDRVASNHCAALAGADDSDEQVAASCSKAR